MEGNTEISSNNYVAAELHNLVINHFECGLCKNIVFQPKECSKCTKPFCHECVMRHITAKKKWECGHCGSSENVVDMHRVVKEILEKLIFKCPGCGGKRNYEEMLKHMNNCPNIGKGGSY